MGNLPTPLQSEGGSILADRSYVSKILHFYQHLHYGEIEGGSRGELPLLLNNVSSKHVSKNY